MVVVVVVYQVHHHIGGGGSVVAVVTVRSRPAQERVWLQLVGTSQYTAGCVSDYFLAPLF